MFICTHTNNEIILCLMSGNSYTRCGCFSYKIVKSCNEDCDRCVSQIMVIMGIQNHLPFRRFCKKPWNTSRRIFVVHSVLVYEHWAVYYNERVQRAWLRRAILSFLWCLQKDMYSGTSLSRTCIGQHKVSWGRCPHLGMALYTSLCSRGCAQYTD